jgi:uncharacterized protein YjbI with pentapeptide repeats
MHAKKSGGERMANQEHLDILKHGVRAWNQWRKEHHGYWTSTGHISPNSRPDFISANLFKADLSGADLEGANFRDANLNGADLSGADLSEADLSEAHLEGANLDGAHLDGANLRYANLSGAFLSGAFLFRADLSKADLSGADLSYANLREANLSLANFSETNLSGADLSQAMLVRTKLCKATLTNCVVYGIAAWDVDITEADQSNLIITDHVRTIFFNEPTITVDNLKVAQFIYLLLSNKEIRDVIDTITSKVVLILGRFTPERKVILDALRDELRKQNYSPIVFDFEKPASRDITETVSTLAHLARFVIADITDAKSIPQELMTIVPNLPSVAVLPLILNSQHEYGMFEHFTKYPWVLPVYCYTDEVSLLQSLKEFVIAPAEQKAQELAKR